MEIALGVLLGLLGVALAALAAHLVARRRSSPPAPDADDLPGFLESPPGTSAAPSPGQPGWATLAPAPSAPPTEPARRRRDSRLVVGALAVIGVLLVALAVVLVTGHDDGRPGHERPAAADDVTARLAFGGVVLDRHAVGVTATYPRLEVTSDGERSRAHLELPTFHCLTGEAPADPVAAGCRRSVTEYADLGSPDLFVTGSGDRLRLSGDFATYLRPAGGPPEPTGRVYPIEVSVASAGGTVEGTLDLGAERAGTTPDPRVNVLRRGS